MVVVASARLFSQRLADDCSGAPVSTILLRRRSISGYCDSLDRCDSPPERKKSALGFEAAAGYGADIRPRGHPHHSLAWTLRDYLVRYCTMKKSDPAGTDNDGAAPRRV